MQNQAKNKNADYASKYRQMTETEDLEEAFEDLKERIEFLTINAQADVGPAIELQDEFAAFCKVLKTRCNQSNFDQPSEDLKRSVKMWAGAHLPYVMPISEEFIAVKTALMQICQEASN